MINLQGRVFMANNDDPFRLADDLLAKTTAKVILVDFHAEATSEKVAMGWFLEGHVTAVLAFTPMSYHDEKLLAGGTAVQTMRDEQAFQERDRRPEEPNRTALPRQHARALRGCDERCSAMCHVDSYDPAGERLTWKESCSITNRDREVSLG